MLDFISQNPTIAAALAGVAMFFLAGVVKKTGMPGQYVAAGLAVVVGMAYTAFQMFVPVEVQQSIVGFATTAFTTSWALYEMIWKPAKAKMIASGLMQE